MERGCWVQHRQDVSIITLTWSHDWSSWGSSKSRLLLLHCSLMWSVWWPASCGASTRTGASCLTCSWPRWTSWRTTSRTWKRMIWRTSKWTSTILWTTGPGPASSTGLKKSPIFLVWCVNMCCPFIGHHVFFLLLCSPVNSAVHSPGTNFSDYSDTKWLHFNLTVKKSAAVFLEAVIVTFKYWQKNHAYHLESPQVYLVIISITVATLFWLDEAPLTLKGIMGF